VELESHLFSAVAEAYFVRTCSLWWDVSRTPNTWAGVPPLFSCLRGLFHKNAFFEMLATLPTSELESHLFSAVPEAYFVRTFSLRWDISRTLTSSSSGTLSRLSERLIQYIGSYLPLQEAFCSNPWTCHAVTRDQPNMKWLGSTVSVAGWNGSIRKI
jgi:hypothetical protein